MISVFDSMQAAVDIVKNSPHPDSKVAACLFTTSSHIARTNDWPAPIKDKIGEETRIGDSSGTVHAEVNCLLHFPEKTEGASLAITDPCCPNCAKAIAESGIKTLYIDHKGFHKDFALRRGDDFKDMSLRILAHAGLSIYEVNRKAKTLKPIFEPEPDYIPPQENPIKIRPAKENGNLQTFIDSVQIKHERWGCAYATDKDGKKISLVASTHPAIGYTEFSAKDAENKYDFYLEPISRLLFGAARHGLELDKENIWTSVVPTPREMVNFVGAGFNSLKCGNLARAKKDASFSARDLLTQHDIITFKEQKRTEKTEILE